MGRFRTFFENTEIGGEYWITDGYTQEAGGDGDYNHEAYAHEQVIRQVANSLDVDHHITDAEFIDWDEVQKNAVERYLESLDEQQQMQLRQQLGMSPEEDLNDESEKIFGILAQQAGVDDETLAMANGFGDAREYAIKHWGWKRVAGNHVETWQLTPEDMKDIASGIGDIDDQLLDETPIYIYVYSTGQHHESTLGDLEQGRLEYTPVPQMAITPVQMQQATNQSVKNAEIEKLHPYYKDVSPRSQSFPFGDWCIY